MDYLNYHKSFSCLAILTNSLELGVNRFTCNINYCSAD